VWLAWWLCHLFALLLRSAEHTPFNTAVKCSICVCISHNCTSIHTATVSRATHWLHPSCISYLLFCFYCASFCVVLCIVLCWCVCRIVLSRQSTALRGASGVLDSPHDRQQVSRDDDDADDVGSADHFAGSVACTLTVSAGMPPDTTTTTTTTTTAAAPTAAATSTSTRRMFLHFSPVAAMTVTQYRITSAGLQGISYYHCPA
jgi:hypothetical protein